MKLTTGTLIKKTVSISSIKLFIITSKKLSVHLNRVKEILENIEILYLTSMIGVINHI